jgi:hypothetical protein
MTYNKQGVVKRPDAKHHAIAYMGDTKPAAFEGENLVKHAIKIDPRNGATLHEASRINFSKVYTIEHHIKVKSIGVVPEEYMVWVRYYWDELMSSGTTAPSA